MLITRDGADPRQTPRNLCGSPFWTVNQPRGEGGDSRHGDRGADPEHPTATHTTSSSRAALDCPVIVIEMQSSCQVAGTIRTGSLRVPLCGLMWFQPRRAPAIHPGGRKKKGRADSIVDQHCGSRAGCGGPVARRVMRLRLKGPPVGNRGRGRFQRVTLSRAAAEAILASPSRGIPWRVDVEKWCERRSGGCDDRSERGKPALMVP